MSKEDKLSICVLGCPGAGKTSFLAGLAYLAEDTQDSVFQIKGKSGTDSQIWLADLAKNLRERNWPTKTAETKVYSLDFLYKKRWLSLEFVDYVGESFLDGVGDLERDETKPIGEFLKRSNVIIILLDPTVDIIDPIFASQEEQNVSTERVNALLAAVLGSALNQSLPNMDIALVISKADTVPGHQDATAAKRLIEVSLPGFYQKLTELKWKKRLAHFFLSSVGETETDQNGRDKPSTQISPYGYEALFDWILSRHLEKQFYTLVTTWSKRGLVAAGALFIILALVAIYYLRLTEPINNPNELLSKRVETFLSLPFKTPQIETDMENVVKETLTRLRGEMEASSSESQLEDILEELTPLKQLLKSSYALEIKRLDTDLIDKMEKILVDKIKYYIDNNLLDDATLNIGEYKTKYTFGKLSESVSDMTTFLSLKREQSARRQVNDITLSKRATDEWSAFLEDKATAVESYITQNETNILDSEKQDMLKAVELARYLASHSSYTLTIKANNGLIKADKTYLIIQILGKNNSSLQTDSQNSKNPSWNQIWNISWIPGNAVLVKWYRDDYVNDDLMAWLSDDSIWSLEILTGQVLLNVEKDWLNDMVESPTATFELTGNSSDGQKRFESNDWILLKRYIHPGTIWHK
jgi:hypothetical protein